MVSHIPFDLVFLWDLVAKLAALRFFEIALLRERSSKPLIVMLKKLCFRARHSDFFDNLSFAGCTRACV